MEKGGFLRIVSSYFIAHQISSMSIYMQELSHETLKTILSPMAYGLKALSLT